ncbi:SRPBCC family protein [Streptomyces anandii]|uniref:SRPBCC family protein n=1 Tax=Streptomyces anandii TaxID=285454 RepID=UPI0037A5F8CE
MELHHEFTVPVPVDDAWRALLDIERIAPCLPGATVEEYDGKTVTGSVKVRLGPITVTYKGTAVFEEQDEAAHRMVLAASGRETRGQGTARATVTGTLEERDGTTAVSVRTDLTVTGRPAQFGRGVMAEVGDRLVGQFADCLAARLAEPAAEAAPEAGAGAVTEAGAGAVTEAGAETSAEPAEKPAAGTRAQPPAYAPAEPIDLLRTAGGPVAKRVAVAGGAAAALVLLVVAVRRLRRR